MSLYFSIIVSYSGLFDIILGMLAVFFLSVLAFGIPIRFDHRNPFVCLYIFMGQSLNELKFTFKILIKWDNSEE